MRQSLVTFALGMSAGVAFAGPPAAVEMPAPFAPQTVAAAPAAIVGAAPAPVVVAAPPAPCVHCVPAGGWWRVADRPILLDEGFRYEPRIRDQRFSAAYAPLPGGFAGQRETLPVLPAYRQGYFRMFQGR